MVDERKVNSASEALSASILYLYQAYLESGMTTDEAMKETTYQAIKKITDGKMAHDYIIIKKNNENSEYLERLLKLIKLLVDSKQSHVSQIGVEIASIFDKLFN